jgi:hypothetical protein
VVAAAFEASTHLVYRMMSEDLRGHTENAKHVLGEYSIPKFSFL